MTSETAPRRARPPWTVRQRLMAALFVGWVAFQFVIPAEVLTSPRRKAAEVHFGWQMFTRAKRTVGYAGVTANGAQRAIDARAEAGPLWGNAHYGSGTARRLCEADPRLVRVVRFEVNRRGKRKAQESFTCP